LDICQSTQLWNVHCRYCNWD